MYKWKKQELLAKKILASILNKKDIKDHYDLILRQMDLSEKKFNLEDILILNKKEEINYFEALRRFTTGLEYLSEDIYLSMAEIFMMIEDHEALRHFLKLPKYKLNEQELIDIVSEMIYSFNIKEFNEIYKRIINPKLHQLNIQNNINETIGAVECINGITLIDPLFKKSYINIFRNYTLEDVEVLFHEVMHAIFYELMRKHYKMNKNNIYLLQELEGQFASLYSYDYLSSIGYKSEAKLLKKDYIDGILTSSFLIIVNHVLFATSINQKFDLSAASKRMNEQLRYPIILTEEQLSECLNINGLVTLTTMISSLISMEIIDKEISLQDKIELLYNLKLDDSIKLDDNMKKYNVDFKANNFKTLIKTYKELH